jgi:microcystin-dependent protein
MAFGAHGKPTVGDIKFSAVNYSHLGWILCDGSTLNVADFEFLFNVIGYSFGGSGTSFILPNPAGRVPGAIGIGNDANVSSLSSFLGQTIGEYEHVLTIPEMPRHNHGVNNSITQDSNNNSTSVVAITVNDPGHTHSYTAPGNQRAYDIISPANQNIGTVGSTTGSNVTGITLNNGTHAHTLNPAGGDTSHNNVQPTIFMGNMFIYTGLPRYGASVYQTGKNIW